MSYFRYVLKFRIRFFWIIKSWSFCGPYSFKECYPCVFRCFSDTAVLSRVLYLLLSLYFIPSHKSQLLEFWFRSHLDFIRRYQQEVPSWSYQKVLMEDFLIMTRTFFKWFFCNLLSEVLRGCLFPWSCH